MDLDENRMRTMHAALDRLIPADDYPGGWDAGCGSYIMEQLGGQLTHLLPMYIAGLDGIDAEASAEYAQRFADTDFERQDTLLRRIERGEVLASWQTDPKLFFAVLVSHAAEGYYANSAQGGNRDRVAWKMIGFNGR